MQRRLEEPPMLNYTKFIDELVPPDTRMRLLFPNDVETRTKYRVTLTEVQLLDFYRVAIVQTHYAINGDPADLKRDNFTENLLKEITFDYNEVGTEFYALFQQAPRGTLQMWEYHNLDQDGGTKGLEDALKSREDVFVLRVMRW